VRVLMVISDTFNVCLSERLDKIHALLWNTAINFRYSEDLCKLGKEYLSYQI